MKTLTLKKNSWHYWFASQFGSDANSPWIMEKRTKDLCSYSRAILLNMFFGLTLLLFGVMVFGILFAVPLYAIFTHIAPALLSGTVGCWLGIITVATIFGIEALRERFKKSTAPKQPKQPGFLKLWYRSFKEKTCFLVKFE